MSLTAHCLAGYCLFCLQPAPAHPPESRHPDAVMVHINAEFDRSITPGFIKAFVKDEATAIWRGYGVELVWSSAAPRAPLDLDVAVARQPPDGVFDRSTSVLGRTTIDHAGVVHGPIRVSFDTVSSLLQHRESRSRLTRHLELARALGRVLAHELGHVLLGAPAYHDHDGLMRATFPSDELAQPDRRGFRLTADSAARLRARLAAFADTPRLQSGWSATPTNQQCGNSILRD